jgi:hypothetical protein
MLKPQCSTLEGTTCRFLPSKSAASTNASAQICRHSLCSQDADYQWCIQLAQVRGSLLCWRILWWHLACHRTWSTAHRWPHLNYDAALAHDSHDIVKVNYEQATPESCQRP